MPEPRPEKGNCTWCAEAIVFPPRNKKAGQQNLRCSWHPVCIRDYKLATRGNWQRKAVFKRDKGVCVTCGQDTKATGVKWEADHYIPLWSVPRDLPFGERMSFWGLGNLYTACEECHTRKTSEEATMRAEMRATLKVKPEKPAKPVKTTKTKKTSVVCEVTI
jgi:5-methylcytosine-specific restriction endonuclease McrA